MTTLGSRADMASRAESRLSRINSAASSLQGPDKASVDEVSSLCSRVSLEWHATFPTVPSKSLYQLKFAPSS